MYKTSNISNVKCITFIKCWFKTQAGISQVFSTITAQTICLLNITVCGIKISISQYHNIKAICSLFDLCHNIESSASPSCFLHFQFHLITGSAKHKIIKTVTKPIGRIGDLSVNIQLNFLYSLEREAPLSRKEKPRNIFGANDKVSMTSSSSP